MRFIFVHLRLKWDKVLLVLIVHFARYDVGDIHYCGKTWRGEYSIVVTDIAITAQ